MQKKNGREAVGSEKGHGHSFLSPFKLKHLLPGTHSHLPPAILKRVSHQKSHCFSEVLPGRIHFTDTVKLNLPTRLECFELSLAHSIGYLWNCCPCQQTCTRSQSGPRLGLKIKAMIQDRYIFSAVLLLNAVNHPGLPILQFTMMLKTENKFGVLFLTNFFK